MKGRAPEILGGDRKVKVGAGPDMREMRTTRL